MGCACGLSPFLATFLPYFPNDALIRARESFSTADPSGHLPPTPTSMTSRNHQSAFPAKDNPSPPSCSNSSIFSWICRPSATAS